MRFRDGFSLDELPDLQGLISNNTDLLKTPDLFRRFLSRSFFSLEDIDRAGPEALVIVGAGTRLEARANLRCAAVLAEDGVEGFPESLPVLRIRDARKTLTRLLTAFASRI